MVRHNIPFSKASIKQPVGYLTKTLLKDMLCVVFQGRSQHLLDINHHRYSDGSPYVVKNTGCSRCHTRLGLFLWVTGRCFRLTRVDLIPTHSVPLSRGSYVTTT